LPSEHAVTIALRTQQIIAEESGVTNTVDPLGGSFFVEAQTDRMEKERTPTSAAVEDWAESSLPLKKDSSKAKFPTRRIVINARSTVGIRKIVGVNAYAEEKPLTIPILRMDPNGYTNRSRLNEVRKTRDNGRVGQTLDKLRIACEGTENTMPYIMECVHAYCTLGEIVV
jgi:methylmalonyl-CoA mutase N-terminal domain/subunit